MVVCGASGGALLFLVCLRHSRIALLLFLFLPFSVIKGGCSHPCGRGGAAIPPTIPIS